MPQVGRAPAVRHFQIQGIRRAGCAAAIERAAGAVAGVGAAVCEPVSGRLRVEGRFQAGAVVDAVAALGYRIQVEGVPAASPGAAARLTVAAVLALGGGLAYAAQLLPQARGPALVLWMVASLPPLLWLAAPALRPRQGGRDPAAVIGAGASLCAWLTLALGQFGGLDPRPYLYLPFAIALLAGVGARLARPLHFTPGERAWRQCASRRLALLAGLGAALAAAVWAGSLDAAQSALAAVLTCCAVLSPFALALAGPWVHREADHEALDAGVLLGNVSLLRRLDRLDTVFLCRTGVVTGGAPEVVGVEPRPGVRIPDLFRYAAALEAGLEQPLARALVRAADGRGGSRASEVELVPGGGVRGRVAEQTVIVGHCAFLHAQGVDTAPLEARAAEMATDGCNAVWVAVDGELRGLLEIADPVRSDTAEAVRRLRRLGLRVALVSAAPAATLEAIGRSIEVDRVLSAAPAALAGQGAERRGAAALVWSQPPPELDVALLSVALSPGAQHPRPDADITLRRPSLHALVEAIELARRAQRLVRAGRLFAVVYHGLGLAWAAGLFFPLFGLAPRPGLGLVAAAAALAVLLFNARRSRRQPVLVEAAA